MVLFKGVAKTVSRLDSFNNWIKLFSILMVFSFLLSLGGAYYWALDLFRHFIVQYALLSLLFGVLATTRKLWLYVLLMAVLSVLCGLEVAGRLDYVSNAPEEAIRGDDVLKVIVYNRHHSLTDHKAMVDFIRSENPDIFFILEANSSHAETLKKDLNAAYPYLFLLPKDNSAFGMVAASKHRFKLKWNTHSHLLGEEFDGIANFIMIASIVPDGHKPVTFYALHTPPPMRPYLFTQRNAELKHVADLINQRHRKRDDSIVLLGDWNITPYSPFFSRLLKDAGLKNQTTTPYFLPSWPSNAPAFAQIPIDHILFKGMLRLLEKRRGPSLGSDHHAIIAVFKIVD